MQGNISTKQAAAAKLDAQIEAIIKKEIELARLAEEKKQKEAAAKLQKVVTISDNTTTENVETKVTANAEA